jgi:hypothetical protein
MHENFSFVFHIQIFLPTTAIVGRRHCSALLTDRPNGRGGGGGGGGGGGRGGGMIVCPNSSQF